MDVFSKGLKAGFLMSGKKRHEVHLQVEVNTPEEWNHLCKRDGLIVVDVYSDWCGPCEAMIPLLKKIKNELPSGGPEILCFAAAKSDSIKSLSSYHGKSEPTWLFISGGRIIQELYGANAPLLYRTIQKEFEKERLVIKGDLKRVPLYPGQELMLEVETPVTAQVEVRRCSSSRIKEAMRQYILAVFEPRMADSEEKMKSVLDFICNSPSSSFQIAECKLYQFSEAEVMELFNIDNRELMESQHAERILNVYTEGKAMILVVAQKPEISQDAKFKDAHVIKKAWGTFLGPESASEARSLAPESFRANFLKPDLDQGTWCDMSQEIQVKMMRQHFPDFVDNLVSGTGTASLKELAHCVELLCLALKPLGSKGTPSFEDEGVRPEECTNEQQQDVQVEENHEMSPTKADNAMDTAENPEENHHEVSQQLETQEN